jgi:hypothetical protein
MSMSSSGTLRGEKSESEKGWKPPYLSVKTIGCDLSLDKRNVTEESVRMTLALVSEYVWNAPPVAP